MRAEWAIRDGRRGKKKRKEGKRGEIFLKRFGQTSRMKFAKISCCSLFLLFRLREKNLLYRGRKFVTRFFSENRELREKEKQGTVTRLYGKHEEKARSRWRLKTSLLIN